MAMVSIPPGSRKLEDLPELLDQECPDVVKEANYIEGPPEFVALRCKGVACPWKVSAIVGQSRFLMNTSPADNSLTCEVIIFSGEK